MVLKKYLSIGLVVALIALASWAYTQTAVIGDWGWVNSSKGNLSVGEDALSPSTTGTNNTVVAIKSLKNNTTGSNNVAMGIYSLSYNTIGYSNTAVGTDSLGVNTSGYSNTAVGLSSLGDNTTADSNTAVGVESLGTNTTGIGNVAVGFGAGQFITGGVNPNLTSSLSVHLGTLTKASASGNTNEIVIGYNTTGSGSNTATLGSTGITSTYLRGQVFFTAISFASLGTPSNGAFVYCSDCTFANPCAGAGTGAFAKRLNGAWRCD